MTCNIPVEEMTSHMGMYQALSNLKPHYLNHPDELHLINNGIEAVTVGGSGIGLLPPITTNDSIPCKINAVSLQFSYAEDCYGDAYDALMEIYKKLCCKYMTPSTPSTTVGNILHMYLLNQYNNKCITSSEQIALLDFMYLYPTMLPNDMVDIEIVSVLEFMKDSDVGYEFQGTLMYLRMGTFLDEYELVEKLPSCSWKMVNLSGGGTGLEVMCPNNSRFTVSSMVKYPYIRYRALHYFDGTDFDGTDSGLMGPKALVELIHRTQIYNSNDSVVSDRLPVIHWQAKFIQCSEAKAKAENNSSLFSYEFLDFESLTVRRSDSTYAFVVSKHTYLHYCSVHAICAEADVKIYVSTFKDLVDSFLVKGSILIFSILQSFKNLKNFTEDINLVFK